MKMKYSITMSILLSALAVQASGCACRDAVPILVQATNLTTEAGHALGQVEAMLASIDKMDPVLKIKIQIAIAKAHSALQEASVALRKAREDCVSPDYPDIFREFNAAWSIIRSILPMLLAEVNRTNARADASNISPIGTSAQVVKDPSVFLLK